MKDGRVLGSLLIVIGFLSSGWGLLSTTRSIGPAVLLRFLAPIGLLAILAGILLLLVPGFFEASHGF